MRLPHLLGLGTLMLALLVSGASSQDKDKKDDKNNKKEEKKKDEKKKDGLPAGFKGIDLSKDQLEKIGVIRTEYKPKIDDLSKKLGEVKKMEIDDILKVLTADQRKMYDENVAKKKDKKKDDTKKDDKKKDDKK